MHAHLQMACVLVKQMQVLQIASMVEENSLSVDTPLHDMAWQPNDLQSRLARHRITHPWTLYDFFGAFKGAVYSAIW